MAGLLSKLVVKAVDATKKTPTELKLLSRRELRAVLKLFYQEGWIDFKLEDLEFMFRVSPKTCFKFVANDEMVGVTFALLLDNGVCYPNSSIIAKEHRKKVKYHAEVLKYADYLKKIAKFEVMYSAKWLVDLYTDGMGYQAVADIHRYSINSNQAFESATHFERLNLDNQSEVVEFLTNIYRSERTNLIEQALKYQFNTAIARDSSGQIIGFAMRRGLPKYDQIGPVVTSDQSLAGQLIHTLAKDFFSNQADPARGLIIDGEKIKLQQCLSHAKVAFEPEGTEMVKMIRGDQSLREDETKLFAIFSHYLS